MVATTSLPAPAAMGPSAAPAERLARIRAEPIAYIENDQFAVEPTDRDPLVEQVLALNAEENSGSVARLGESELLTREQERALFRRMNQVKYLAAQQQADLPTQDASEEVMDAIEVLLDE